MHRSVRVSALLAIVLITSMTSVMTEAVHAAPDVDVKVTLERIRLTGGDDGCGDPDWYAIVFINGVAFSNLDTPSQNDHEGNADISPNWEFSSSVDAAALADPGRIPLSVEIWEEDGGFCFGPDLFDASQSAGSAIAGTAIIAPCGASLDGRAINCGASSVFSGTASDRVEVTLTVDVTPPPSAPGLRIRCMHTPAWPMDGQPITITATPLDGALAPLIADDLEIWVQTDASDAATRTKVLDLAGVPSATYTFTPPDDVEQFAYGCRLIKNGTEIFSSWHRSTAGDPGTSDIPILYTGPRSSRIDIVFIADRDTYPRSADPDVVVDPNFVADVAQAINISYYGFDPFLTGQDKFNFWILLSQGRADDADDGDCDHDLPPRWDDLYAYADAGAILHRKSQRDCALRGDRIFSSTLDTNYRPDAFQVLTHETGHQPFGLADEYCCDGGYFQQDVAPNVYEEPEDCAADAAALGRTASACREWEEVVENWFDPDWSTSEPPGVAPPRPPMWWLTGGDLMADNGLAQAADVRRFNLMFTGCQAAGC